LIVSVQLKGKSNRDFATVQVHVIDENDQIPVFQKVTILTIINFLKKIIVKFDIITQVFLSYLE